MAKVFGIIGMMTCIYVLYELLSSVSRSSNSGPVGILDVIVSFLMLACMVSSFPICWLVRWHDSVMEKLHRKQFHESQVLLDDIRDRKERQMESEISSLKSQLEALTNQLKEAQKRPSYSELFLGAHDQGYKEGYRDGQQDHAAGINLLEELVD